MENFTAQSCDLLRKEINTALEQVSRKHNIKISFGKMAYNSDSINVKLQLTTLSESGEDLSGKKNFELYASWFGVSPEDYGKVIDSNGKKLKLINIDTKKRKYPFISVDVVTGTQYKHPQEQVVRLLGK